MYHMSNYASPKTRHRWSIKIKIWSRTLGKPFSKKNPYIVDSHYITQNLISTILLIIFRSKSYTNFLRLIKGVRHNSQTVFWVSSIVRCFFCHMFLWVILKAKLRQTWFVVMDSQPAEAFVTCLWRNVGSLWPSRMYVILFGKNTLVLSLFTQ